MASLFSRNILARKSYLRALVIANEKLTLKPLSSSQKIKITNQIRLIHSSKRWLAVSEDPVKPVDEKKQQNGEKEQKDDQDNDDKELRLPAFIIAFTVFLFGLIKVADCDAKENSYNAEDCNSSVLIY